MHERAGGRHGACLTGGGRAAIVGSRRREQRAGASRGRGPGRASVGRSGFLVVATQDGDSLAAGEMDAVLRPGAMRTRVANDDGSSGIRVEEWVTG